MALPSKPITRQETYLSNIAGQATQLPDAPITREEKYLDYIAKNGGGGGTGEGDMKKSAYDADEAVFNAGGIKAFVNSSISGKVDKVEGKGLSSNDYDDSAKAIVDNVTSALDGKVSKSNTAGLLKNDGTVDTNTYAQTSALSGYIAKSNTAGLVKNDGTIDTTTTGAVAANTSAISAIKDGTDIDSFADVESALSGYIAKSNTAGLVKNDGTIDTTKYASQNALGTVAKLFNSTASYTEGNYVIYNEELYQCETDHTGAWNASHFRKYLAGVANMLNSQYTQASTLAYPFSPDSNYKKGDYVVYFDGYVNLYYKFTQDHSGAWNASHVEQIKIFEELNDLRAAAFPRSEQAVLVAKNWFNYTKETTSNNGVTFTNSNNQSCTLSGQATADQAAIEMGTLTVDKDTEFIFNGASSSNNAKIHMYVFDSTTNARPYTDSSKTTLQTNNCFGTGANSEIPFFAEAGHVIKIYARVQTTGTSVPSDTVFWPMVRLATDPDPTFAPYAMTNKELTEKVASRVIFKTLSGGDLDDILTTGWYSWGGTAPTHSPQGVAYSCMQCIVETGVQKQIVYFGADVIYMRQRSGSPATWGSWYKFQGTIVS